MSSTKPTTLRAGPATTNALASRWFILLYLLVIWLSIFPCFFLFAKLFSIFEVSLLFIGLILPLFLFIIYVIFFVSSIIWSLLILRIVNLFHTPREGVFPRDPRNKDYFFWSLRSVIKKFPIWVCHNFGPFPWTDVFAMKRFGNKITYKSPVFDAWVDAEMIDIGKATTIGQGCVIMTSMITLNNLILKRVVIGKDCVIGAHSVISPGTTMGDNVILGALSTTNLDQELDAGWVYMGNPAEKIKPSDFRINDEMTAHERALQKEYEQIKAEIIKGEEKEYDLGVKNRYQIRKSKKKKKKALNHLEKALYQHAKAVSKEWRAELKVEKFEDRASKHRLKALKQKQEALAALEKVKTRLSEKLKEETSI